MEESLTGLHRCSEQIISREPKSRSLQTHILIMRRSSNGLGTLAFIQVNVGSNPIRRAIIIRCWCIGSISGFHPEERGSTPLRRTIN